MVTFGGGSGWISPAVSAILGHVAGTVNTILVEVERRRDGKLYPPRPLTHAERNRARWLAHNLVHRDGMSVRAAQRAMAAQGVRRSVGIIARDLAAFECPDCPARLARQQAAPADNHQQPGQGGGWAGPAPSW